MKKITVTQLSILYIFSVLFLTTGWILGAQTAPPTPTFHATPIFNPTSTPGLHASPEPHAGSVYSPAPFTLQIENLCQVTPVRGGPSQDLPILYFLPENSYIVPRERFGSWTMIQPAHWLPTSSICGE